MRFNIWCKILIIICVVSVSAGSIYSAYASSPDGVNEKDLAGIFSVKLKGVIIADSTFPENFAPDAVRIVKNTMTKFRRLRLSDDTVLSDSRSSFLDFIKTKSSKKNESIEKLPVEEGQESVDDRYYIFASMSKYNESTNTKTSTEEKTDSSGKKETVTITTTTKRVSMTINVDFADAETGKIDTQTFPLEGEESIDEEDSGCNPISILLSVIFSVLDDSGEYQAAQEDALNKFYNAFLASLEKNRVLWVPTKICGVDHFGLYVNKGKYWDVKSGYEYTGIADAGRNNVYIRIKETRDTYSSAAVLTGIPEAGAELERMDYFGLSFKLDGGITSTYSLSSLSRAAEAAVQSGSFSSENSFRIVPVAGISLFYDIGYDWKVMTMFSAGILPRENSMNCNLYDIGAGGGRRIYFGMTSVDLYLLTGFNVLTVDSGISSSYASGIGVTTLSAGDVNLNMSATSIYLKPGISLNRQIGHMLFLSMFADCSVPCIKNSIKIEGEQNVNGADQKIYSERFSSDSLRMFFPRVGISAALRF